MLVLAALAVGIFCFVGREDKLRIPENVEVSNVTFSTKNGNLICIFVPSVGSSDIDYEVTYYSLNGSFPSETVTAKYESGICTATIEESRMKKQMSYGVILNIRYKMRREQCRSPNILSIIILASGESAESDARKRTFL